MAKQRKVRLSKWVIAFVLVVLLVTGVVSARILYNQLREPDFYTPSGEIDYTTPIDKTSKSTKIKPKEPGSKALLPGAKWVPQTFNNCGPATTSMVLQYFGYDVNQNETKAHLRTNSDDKNVFTYEIADYM